MEDERKDMVEKHKSQANCIYVPRTIIQQDVCQAEFHCQDMRRRNENASGPMMQSPAPGEWEKDAKAYHTLARAHRHQPGERGSMTFGPNTLSREK